VITEALVAFTWLFKFPLPAVQQNANQLTMQLFILLKDYSKAGAARGENFSLVQNCFKVQEMTNAHTHTHTHTWVRPSVSLRNTTFF